MERRTLLSELLYGFGMLRIKVSKCRRTRENQRLELMHLDVREKIRVADVRFPSLFDAAGLLGPGQAAPRRSMMTGKKRRERVKAYQGGEDIGHIYVTSGKLIKDVFSNRVVIRYTVNCVIRPLITTDAKTCPN